MKKLPKQGRSRVQVSAIVDSRDYDKAKAAAERALGPFRIEREMPLEVLILRMLADSEGEMNGADLVKESDGKLKRETVYATLGRMGDKKLIRSRKQKQIAGEIGRPRRLYKPSAAGRRVLAEYLMQDVEQ